MLIKGEGSSLLHSNSYCPQSRHWPAPEHQAHTSHVLECKPCPHSALLLLPNLSGTWQSTKRWGVGMFLFQTASDTTLMWCFHQNLCSPVSHPCTKSPPGTARSCSSRHCSSDPTTLAQSCDETSGEKGKANSRFIGVWFTSLNYFPPSSALPPLGNASPSLHAGIWKNQMNSKCFQGRHQTKLGHNSSLPAGTENTTKIPTTQDTQCLQRHLSGRSRD